MRFRLGLLQDHAAIDKQIAQEAAEAQAKKHKHESEGPKTEAQTKLDEAAAAKAKEKGTEKVKQESKRQPKIRPLSEAKAIDSGANFVSETFLLIVAVGCVFGERWYSSKKETSRREDVAERIAELEEYEKSARKGLVELEKEILRLRAKDVKSSAKKGRILPKEVYELEEKEEGLPEKPKGWFSWFRNASDNEDPKMDLDPEAASLNPATTNDVEPQTTVPSVIERVLHPLSTHHIDHEPTSNQESEVQPSKAPTPSTKPRER